MNILIITPDYPDKNRSVYTFVRQLVNQFALLGHRCCVIAPYNVTRNKRFYQFREIEEIERSTSVEVLRPNYLSFSETTIMGFRPSEFFVKNAIKRAMRKLPFTPDVIYAHFWRSGRLVYELAKESSIPLFVATGESVIPNYDISHHYQDFYDYVRGVVCVSSNKRDESVENGLTTNEKCQVIPNAINDNLFKKLDKQECRRMLGIPKNIFVIAFVGWFNERKGVHRVAKAITSIKGEPVYSMFIGGKDEIDCPNILIKDRIDHDKIPAYLNAADVFVLPTLQEGCCNAVIEAMACGLPIISSDLPFNWDVLNTSNSILVNPKDIGQISEAIVRLRDNRQLREKLSNGALSSAQNLTIEKRADTILRFIESKI